VIAERVPCVVLEHFLCGSGTGSVRDTGMVSLW
jgi:hypothetical protein